MPRNNTKFEIGQTVIVNIECIFLIFLIYDKTNPNSKTENYTCIQISFHNVNTNNTSSGLREKCYTYQFGDRIWWEKYGAKIKDRGER